jgi:hypothetical protein
VRNHQPVPESDMDWVSPDNTICETIRRAYHTIKKYDEQDLHGSTLMAQAMLDLRIATAMAKSMSAKLTEYNRKWSNGFYENNQSFPKKRHSKMLDVLFLCWDDNSNTGWKFLQCARYLGLNAVMFKGKPHPFNYPNQAPVLPQLSSPPIAGAPITVMAPGIEPLINSAHVVHLIASTYPMAAVEWGKINVVVQHGGTAYRQNPEDCNHIFNQMANKTIVQTPDLMGLGANNESLILFPVDTDKIQPDFRQKGDKPIVGHFPSNPDVKGSFEIEQVLQGIDGIKLVIDYHRVSWEDNLKRMAKCDIIIDGCSPEQNGKPYGAFGNQTLEAAALGCSVITHCVNEGDYNAEYGDLVPHVSNTPEELRDYVKAVAGDLEWIQKHKERCREWVEKCHSIPATANRLYDKVYKDFF